jgi:hypothetical protein
MRPIWSLILSGTVMTWHEACAERRVAVLASGSRATTRFDEEPAMYVEIVVFLLFMSLLAYIALEA